MSRLADLIRDLAEAPQDHRHTWEELQRCCTVEGALSMQLIDAHTGFGNGPQCDVIQGKCGCGALHGDVTAYQVLGSLLWEIESVLRVNAEFRTSSLFRRRVVRADIDDEAIRDDGAAWRFELLACGHVVGVIHSITPLRAFAICDQCITEIFGRGNA